MIDVENHVFDAVYASVSGVVPSGNFASVYVPAPASFPFVYSMDKQECRMIADVLDRAMYKLNFTRLSMAFIPNLADRTIYRINSRYQAVADTNNVMYRRA